MDFMTSVKSCFSKYATFSGRAIRSEFWWFALFTLIASLVMEVVDMLIFGTPMGAVKPLGTIFSLLVLLPSLAVGARRLHDIGKSGWWQLLWLVPIIGWIILIYWFTQKSHEGENKYG
jgi:uncharacterized membrane protein YhaH (DUF805 family)